MTSSERILAGIAEAGKKQSDEIIAGAQAQAEALIAQAQAAAKVKADEVIGLAEKKAQLIRSSGKSAAALLVRDKALAVRRDLIDRVLRETVEDICSFSDEKYFAFLLPLIERGRMDAQGVLSLSGRDLKRDTSDFVKKLEQLSLTLSDTPAEIEGGFILRYDDIFINGELSALIREKRAELVDNVNRILFP